MNKRKILIVFGTRPEAIKMAPVVKRFLDCRDEFDTKVCVTAQHRQMLDQVLTLFDIKPDYDLDIMRPNQDLYDIFTGIMLKIREIYSLVKPDMVLVHGDTSTSTAAALAAFYQQIPVAHVEAGLRTNNIYSPWPEEMNRQITSRIATLNFAPTEIARQNLLRENIAGNQIAVTGNTVIDALRMAIRKTETAPELNSQTLDLIRKFGYDPLRITGSRKLILITGHRRENFGQGFINICEGIRDLSEKYPEIDLVYPVHLNPNVRKSVTEILGKSTQENLFLIEPLDYLPFVYLMTRSYLVLTDSGGIQEEAPDLGKPVIVMRDTTERPEALEAGTIELVGTDREKIVQSVSRLIEDSSHYRKMSEAVNPYGDGKAAERIVDFIKNYYRI
jgi:UDP-N-acetylglucosamine 2-epimerase (non-hydrolysing)